MCSIYVLRVLYFNIILLAISSCNQRPEYNKDDIKGDWSTGFIKKSDIEENMVLTYSFEDTLCSYMFPFNEYTKYTINKEELIIQRNQSDKPNLPELKYEIVKLTKDSLILAVSANTIRLSKIKQKNTVKFDRIGFYSSGCYGSCPVISLEIDSVGNLLFEGFSFTKLKGFYTGRLQKEDLNIIQQKVNALPLDSLKNFYSVSWTDDQTLSVVIKSGNKMIKSSAYGSRDEPVELRLLFHKLMEVYKNVNLTKDTSIIRDSFQLRFF